MDKVGTQAWLWKPSGKSFTVCWSPPIAGGEGLNQQFAHIIINYGHSLEYDEDGASGNRPEWTVSDSQDSTGNNFVFENSVEFALREVLETRNSRSFRLVRY